jgi:hypothetical protein
VGEGPREAIDSTLAMLAEELIDTGLALKPGLKLRRKMDEQTHVIRTQASKWNRSGLQARFEISAWFESDLLGAWKKQRWPGRSPAITQFDRLVNTLQLKFPDTVHHAEWDVVDPAVRPQTAKDAAAIIRDQALPWFERMADPAAALGSLVTDSIQPSLVYYAVATGHSDAARSRIAELSVTSPSFAETLDAVRRDGKPAAYRNAYEPIAWAVVSCGLI